MAQSFEYPTLDIGSDFDLRVMRQFHRVMVSTLDSDLRVMRVNPISGMEMA